MPTYMSFLEAKTGWALSPALSEPRCCRDPGGPVDKGTSLSAAGPLLEFPHGLKKTPATLRPSPAACQ